ncbi:MAG: M1 family metallopeptidase [Rhodothermia bacterium]|nr:M1 family metallopeptidase [Rhodothermia bacterium]
MRETDSLRVVAWVFLCGVLWAGCSSGRVTEIEPSGRIEVAVMPAPSDVESTPDGKGPPTAGRVFPRSYRVYPRSSKPESVPVSGYDILHTELDLEPNFATRTVDGNVVHELVVVAESLSVLNLHGEGLSIHEALVFAQDSVIEAKWRLVAEDLIGIEPGVTLRATDTVFVQLAYSARPHLTGVRRGLHFVDPDGIDPARPTQIWTLGQPQDNRTWLPTWDYPNDRMTFDITVTVPDSLQTFATGTLADQEVDSDNKRSDRTVLNVPQPAYLIGFAAGSFATMEDEYVSQVGKRTMLLYNAEPRSADYLELIFGITPDVMRVVERKTAVSYPFEDLKQTAVRDYTAGGMENTTAVLYDDRIQHDERAHLYYTGRDLVVHEVAHQWFGDYVTCRSWSHLALNEGFANFFEQVYLEEAVGSAEAQEHRILDRNEYLEEASIFRRPIIWADYSDPNLLFDSHSYEKAELVLNTLRFEIGDEAFWSGVRRYLSSNEGFVEIADLKDAMERSTRRPQTRFFEQWFMEPGHPELLVDHGYDDTFGLYEVRVRQVQDTSLFPVYTLEAIVELNYESGAAYKERIRLATADTTYRFGVAGRISFVRFDEGDHLLADIKERKPIEQWLAQAVTDDEMASRHDAVMALAATEPDRNIGTTLIDIASQDDYDLVRMAALQALEPYRLLPEVVVLARRMALEDPSARTRRAAVHLLGQPRDPSAVAVLREALLDDSYHVVAEAVSSLAELRPTDFLKNIAPVLDLQSWEQVVELSILDALSNVPSPGALLYVEGQLAPSKPERLRVAALTTLSYLAESSDELKERAEVILARLSDDVHESVRSEAVRILEAL